MPTTVTLPARAWAVAAAVVVALFVMFTLMLASIESQRQHVIDQDRKVSILFDQAQRLGHAAQPLLHAARPLLTSTPNLLARARGLAPPLRRAGHEAQRLFEAALPVLGQAEPLLLRLNASGAVSALVAVGSLARALDNRGLGQLVNDSRALLAELYRRRLLARAQRAADIAPRLERLLQHQLALQIQTLGIQRQTLAAQLRGLTIQEEALKHVASLDRKSGGQLPPAVP